MPPETESAWQRLGRLLGDRRIEVGARYKNKNLFAEEREINRRMVWSIESGARDTYTTDTIRDVERAYMLVPGSLARTLAGGPLEPLGAPRLSAVPPSAPLHAPGDMAGEVITLLLEDYPPREWWQFLAAIWRLPQDDKLALLLQALQSRQPRAESLAPQGERQAGPAS